MANRTTVVNNVVDNSSLIRNRFSFPPPRDNEYENCFWRKYRCGGSVEWKAWVFAGCWFSWLISMISCPMTWTSRSKRKWRNWSSVRLNPKSMRCKASSVRKPTNSESGLLSTSTVGKLSHFTSATGVVRVPKPFGSQYPRATESMLCSIQMAGVPMRESFHKISIESSKSKSGLPITSSGLTARWDKGYLGWSENHSPFPRNSPIILVPSSISFVTTISTKHYMYSTTANMNW